MKQKKSVVLADMEEVNTYPLDYENEKNDHEHAIGFERCTQVSFDGFGEAKSRGRAFSPARVNDSVHSDDVIPVIPLTVL